MDAVILFFILTIVIPGGIWIAKRAIDLWLSEKYKNRPGNNIILDARAWSWRSQDYEIQFTLRNNFKSLIHLRGLTIVRPRKSKVAWFTHPWKNHPSISHLDSVGISNVHDAKLDVEPGDKKTVSMALRVPSENCRSFVVLARYFIPGRSSAIKIRHKFSLDHAEVPASVAASREVRLEQ